MRVQPDGGKDITKQFIEMLEYLGVPYYQVGNPVFLIQEDMEAPYPADEPTYTDTAIVSNYWFQDWDQAADIMANWDKERICYFYEAWKVTNVEQARQEKSRIFGEWRERAESDKLWARFHVPTLTVVEFKTKARDYYEKHKNSPWFYF